MPSIKELMGTESQTYDSIIKKVNFNLRCCVPGVIQSYNPENNTAEIQPAIREEIVNEDNSISYLNLPLLVNVPILFPTCSLGSIKFPISQGDECLVLFSDLPYDNFWQKGNIQNPIETRRHDLSDGLAIPTIISQPKTKAFDNKGLTLTLGSTTIKMEQSEITFVNSYGQITLTQMIRLLTHTHTAPSLGGETTTPNY